MLRRRCRHVSGLASEDLAGLPTRARVSWVKPRLDVGQVKHIYAQFAGAALLLKARSETPFAGDRKAFGLLRLIASYSL